jgi:hypothetical protein
VEIEFNTEGGGQMKSLSVKVGVILIGFLIFGYAEVWGADWKIYYSNEMYSGYYDVQSITHPSQNIVRVWVMYDYTKKGLLYMVEKLGEKYENLGYSKNLWEIDCLEKKFRILSLFYYDHEGKLIDFLSDPISQDFIVPESNADDLFKEVCK